MNNAPIRDRYAIVNIAGKRTWARVANGYSLADAQINSKEPHKCSETCPHMTEAPYYYTGEMILRKCALFDAQLVHIAGDVGDKTEHGYLRCYQCLRRA
jgi:hypothetical protein